MGNQLKVRPLSQQTIQSIMAHNPGVGKNTEPFPLTELATALALQDTPQPTVLHRVTPFDSLQAEEQIKQFLAFARNVITRYEEDQRLQEELETQTQDLMHYIELSDDMNACQGNKMYRKLADVRRKRRVCKNEIDLLKPLYE